MVSTWCWHITPATRLAGAANVATSAGDDGNFKLAGLTPGPYQVQAALDGIWLSKSVPLLVKNEAGQLAPLHLDIGKPGVPSIVKCLQRRRQTQDRRQGAALIGRDHCQNSCPANLFPTARA